MRNGTNYYQLFYAEWHQLKLSDNFLLKVPFDECSAAMGFQVKEIKRQSRAVKVTHPPADRRQLHKRSDSGLSLSNADHRSSNARHKTCRGAASQVQWSDSVMKRLHKQGFLELVKMWRKPLVLSEERLTPREEKPCGFVHHFCRQAKMVGDEGLEPPTFCV